MRGGSRTSRTQRCAVSTLSVNGCSHLLRGTVARVSGVAGSIRRVGRACVPPAPARVAEMTAYRAPGAA